MAKKKKKKYLKTKAKRKVTSMETNEVSFVNAGANGYSKWILAKKAEDLNLQGSQEERCKKYGIEITDSSHDDPPDNGPTAESMFADPVGLRFPLGKKDNSLDADVILKSIGDFKSDTSEYKETLSKSRIYTRLIRAAMSKNIDIDYDQEDDLDKLLPKEVSDLLAKSTDDEDAVTQDESTEDAHDDEDANTDSSWLDNLRKAAEQAAFIQGIKATIDKSVSTPAAESVTELNKDVGNTEEDDESENQRIEELTKANDEKSESLRLLKLELTKAQAENARLSTTLTKPSSKSAGSGIGKVIESQTYNPMDLSPPLESN
jgi:hypothetical protein